MATKVYCDLCGELIAEFKRNAGISGPKLQRPFVISSYYEGKSLDDENIGWSGPREKVELWACECCNRKFMDGVKKLAEELGLKA